MALPITEFAPAKINLALHVTGQRADGYHLLDSLVAFADIGDHVTASAARTLTLDVSGPKREGVPTDESNLVLKAARLLGADGAHLHLEKHLPAAAGIGGGSSDAAAALRALSRLSGLPLPPDTERLGADIPVCLAPQCQRMEGVGERITPLPPLPNTAILLVNPGVHQPTPAVFKELTQKTNPPLPTIPAFPTANGLIAWLKNTRNDLEPPAIQGAPVIAAVLESLSSAPLARMSGSGATCFALFETREEAEILASALRSARPEGWIAAARLLP